VVLSHKFSLENIGFLPFVTEFLAAVDLNATSANHFGPFNSFEWLEQEFLQASCPIAQPTV